MLSQVIEDGNIVDSYFTADPLTLKTKNADALIFGSSTTEGGDIKVYRDALGNLQMSVDADAASNTEALVIYGGVVCQNYLTVGKTTLDTSYPLSIVGNGYLSGILYADTFFTSSGGKLSTGTGGIRNRNTNQSAININNTVTGADSTDHTINLQIDSNDIIVVQATGDGAGGITNKAIGLYGVTPATQAPAIADATDNATAITQLNLLLAANRSIGLITT